MWETLEFLKELAQDAGAIMLQHWRRDLQVTTKHNGTPVSQVDLAISQMACQRIQAAFPEHVLLTEETFHPSKLPAEKGFIIDELDGTNAFIHGKAGFVFQVAYFENYDQLKLALIFDPVREILVYAIKDKGAWIEKKGAARQAVMPRIRRWRDLKFANHRLYMPPTLRKVYAMLGVSQENIVPTGSIGSKSMSFALGEVHVLVGLNRRMPFWDIAPGILLLQELGYSFSHLTGEKITLFPEDNDLAFGYLVCPPQFEAKARKELEWMVKKLRPTRTTPQFSLQES
ncbi:MAG: inositol monophosphatase [Bacteroidota bacterium]